MSTLSKETETAPSRQTVTDFKCRYNELAWFQRGANANLDLSAQFKISSKYKRQVQKRQSQRDEVTLQDTPAKRENRAPHNG